MRIVLSHSTHVVCLVRRADRLLKYLQNQRYGHWEVDVPKSLL